MSTPLRILWVEDSAEDAELLSSGMEDAGVAHEYRRVEDEAGLRSGLADYAPDLVLSDLSLPGFSGERALEVVREVAPRLPFVFLSGTIGEEAAIEALRNGATDYVLKQAPRRLSTAVERAVREAAVHAEREAAAIELVRAQRMQSLSLLVNGLGQELRNLLQPLGMMPMLLRSSAADDAMRQWADIIEDCARRGGEMVDSMLSFVSGGAGAHERVHVGRVLETLRTLLQGNLAPGVSLRFDIPPQDFVVGGNAVELQQALLSVCLNGIQAMEREGGELVVAVATEPGDRLAISVADTGHGMDAAALARLFTPFYSTRSAGTGLGLASAKRIVESMDGRIRVQSAPGQGSRFELVLPLAVAPQAHAEGAADVLLVHGDATRRVLMCNVLTAHGYHTTAVEDGSRALAEMRQAGAPAVVVVDASLDQPPLAETLQGMKIQGFNGPVLVLYAKDFNPLSDAPAVDLPLYYVEKPILMTRLVETIGRLHAPRTPELLDVLPAPV